MKARPKKILPSLSTGEEVWVQTKFDFFGSDEGASDSSTAPDTSSTQATGRTVRNLGTLSPDQVLLLEALHSHVDFQSTTEQLSKLSGIEAQELGHYLQELTRSKLVKPVLHEQPGAVEYYMLTKRGAAWLRQRHQDMLRLRAWVGDGKSEL